MRKLGKSILLAVVLAAVSTGIASADIGDTLVTAYQKYGDGVATQNAHELRYTTPNGWVVLQSYNDMGVCVYAQFIRTDGKPIGKKLTQTIDGRNVPPYALNPQGNGWTSEKWNDGKNNRNTVNWIWSNGTSWCQVIAGQVRFIDGTTWMYSREYCTPEGKEIVMQDVNAREQAQAQAQAQTQEPTVTFEKQNI